MMDSDTFTEGLAVLKERAGEMRRLIDQYEHALAAYEAAKKALRDAQHHLEPHLVFTATRPIVGNGSRRSDIIRILHKGAPKVFTNAEIVRTLQEQGASASEATLNSAVSRILKDLAEENIALRHAAGKWQFHPDQKYGPRLLAT